MTLISSVQTYILDHKLETAFESASTSFNRRQHLLEHLRLRVGVRGGARDPRRRARRACFGSVALADAAAVGPAAAIGPATVGPAAGLPSRRPSRDARPTRGVPSRQSVRIELSHPTGRFRREKLIRHELSIYGFYPLAIRYTDEWVVFYHFR